MKQKKTIKRIGLCLLLMVAVTTNALANTGTNYYFQVKVSATPTGQGKVYAATSSTAPTADKYVDSYTTPTFSASSDGQAATTTANLFAKAEEGYLFDHWDYYNETAGKWQFHSAQQNASTGNIASGKSSQSDPQVHQFRATFVKKGAIYIASDNETLGTAAIDKLDNEVGDEVTLTATAGVLAGTFEAWTCDATGETFTENPLTVTVTDDNKGKFTAKFKALNMKTQGAYYIVENVSSAFGGHGKLGLMGTTEETSGRYSKNSLLLSYDDKANSSPAFILKLTGTPNSSGGLTSARFAAQGKDSYAVTSTTLTIGNHGSFFSFNGKAGGYTGYIVDYHDATTQEEHFGKVNHPGAYNSSNVVGNNDNQFWWNIYPLTRNDREH